MHAPDVANKLLVLNEAVVRAVPTATAALESQRRTFTHLAVAHRHALPRLALRARAMGWRSATWPNSGPRARSHRPPRECAQRVGGLPFFLQLVGGLVATVATLGLDAVGVLRPGTQPSLVVAAGITALLSGMSVVGTVQDPISGFPVTAAGRAVEIAVLSAGLLVGVILGLRLGLLFGLDLDPAGEVGPRVVRFEISAVSAAVAAAMYALARTRRCGRCSALVSPAGSDGASMAHSPSSRSSVRS